MKKIYKRGKSNGKRFERPTFFGIFVCRFFYFFRHFFARELYFNTTVLY